MERGIKIVGGFDEDEVAKEVNDLLEEGFKIVSTHATPQGTSLSTKYTVYLSYDL